MRAEDGESGQGAIGKEDAVALGETRLVVDGFGGVLSAGSPACGTAQDGTEVPAACQAALGRNAQCSMDMSAARAIDRLLLPNDAHQAATTRHSHSRSHGGRRLDGTHPMEGRPSEAPKAGAFDFVNAGRMTNKLTGNSVRGIGGRQSTGGSLTCRRRWRHVEFMVCFPTYTRRQPPPLIPSCPSRLRSRRAMPSSCPECQYQLGFTLTFSFFNSPCHTPFKPEEHRNKPTSNDIKCTL